MDAGDDIIVEEEVEEEEVVDGCYIQSELFA